MPSPPCLGTHSYPLTTLPLAPGALLALYTDGLMETPGTDIAHAIADLAHRLGESSGRPLHRLVDNLIHHTRHATQHNDDIALLLLQPNWGL
ncbi:SpoIIE family protein phosphatase [Streptomyces sp. 3214.6]|uniref:SpoIIE family protein phosphatase n=1 Tax=Streptomyces sp. 3214.6 TaxID=1882757 RepID=UPI0009A7B2E3|nr:SpoIIE family protein phosphatase [Streptomyces sp. 3214.6]